MLSEFKSNLQAVNPSMFFQSNRKKLNTLRGFWAGPSRDECRLLNDSEGPQNEKSQHAKLQPKRVALYLGTCPVFIALNP